MLDAQSPCSRSLGRSRVTCSGVRSSTTSSPRRPTSLGEPVHEVEQGAREVVGSHPQILPGAVDRVRHMPRSTHAPPHPFRRPRAPRRGIRRAARRVHARAPPRPPTPRRRRPRTGLAHRGARAHRDGRAAAAVRDLVRRARHGRPALRVQPELRHRPRLRAGLGANVVASSRRTPAPRAATSTRRAAR